MDPLDQSQQIDNRSRGKVALEELGARLAAIRRMQARFTATVLAGTAGWWLILFLWTHDVQKANYIFTNTFQFLAVAWCCWFMYPYFLRVEAKQDVSMAMGHDSVDTLDKLARTIDDRVKVVDGILARLDKMTSEAERAGAVKKALDAVDQLRQDMSAVRLRIERDTAPVKVIRRDPVPAGGEPGGREG